MLLLEKSLHELVARLELLAAFKFLSTVDPLPPKASKTQQTLLSANLPSVLLVISARLYCRSGNYTRARSLVAGSIHHSAFNLYIRTLAVLTVLRSGETIRNFTRNVIQVLLMFFLSDCPLTSSH